MNYSLNLLITMLFIFAIFAFIMAFACFRQWRLLRREREQRRIELSQLKRAIMLMSLLALCLPAGAQTQQPTTPGDVISGIGSYFTSFNTNLTWQNTPVSVWTAANWKDNVNTSAELGFSYAMFKPSTNVFVAPEVVLRNADIAGTIVSGSAGVGVGLYHYDTKVTLFADGGYSSQNSSGLFEIGGRLEKKMTISTHAGIGLSYEHFFHAKNGNTPNVNIYLGWDF